MSTTGREVRSALRAALRDLSPGALVLLACSGGADSWALAHAASVLRGAAGLRVGVITVDHGLQEGSAERARAVAHDAVRLGLDPVETVHVAVEPGAADGPEAAARRVRYAALTAAAHRHDAAAVLLGHTRDDQAETVLLGLARGSGARSLAGMRPVHGLYRRPLLGLERVSVRASVPPGQSVWVDPHNAADQFTRPRVRHRVLPVLEKEMGPGVIGALARSADLLRDDADALDAWADREWERLQPGPLPVADLAALPRAVRTRLLRRAGIAAGSPSTELTAWHIGQIERLVTNWRGQDWIDLPGQVRARRRADRIEWS